MICAIVGATGLVGSELLKLLLDNKDVTEVISVGRRSVEIISPKLKQIQTSFAHLEGITLPKIDAAFCCLGTTIKQAGSQHAFKEVDHDFVVKFAEKTISAGVSKFAVVSALGADPSSKFFYNKIKGQTEESLKRLNFKSLYIFQPSLLLGSRTEKRVGEEFLIQLSPLYRPLFFGPLKKYQPIKAEQVAQAMLSLIKTAQPGTHVISNGEMLT